MDFLFEAIEKPESEAQSGLSGRDAPQRDEDRSSYLHSVKPNVAKEKIGRRAFEKRPPTPNRKGLRPVAPWMQGASILIVDQRSSIISSLQGDGVPQNRLMRADDSCRVENAGVQMCPYRPFAASTRSEVFVSFANQKWCVSEYRYCCRAGMFQPGREVANDDWLTSARSEPRVRAKRSRGVRWIQSLA